MLRILRIELPHLGRREVFESKREGQWCYLSAFGVHDCSPSENAICNRWKRAREIIVNGSEEYALLVFDEDAIRKDDVGWNEACWRRVHATCSETGNLGDELIASLKALCSVIVVQGFESWDDGEEEEAECFWHEAGEVYRDLLKVEGL